MSLTIENTVAVRLVWAQSGVDIAVNVLHYIVPGGTVSNSALATAFGDAAGAALTASGLAAQLGTAVTLARVGVRDRRTLNAPMFEDSVGVAGTVAANMLPPHLAMVVTLRTSLAGKGFRGRTYLFGFTEDANDVAGRISAAAQTAGAAFLTELQNVAIPGGNAVLGIAHQRGNNQPLEPGQINAVENIVVRDSVWDTQRRRATPGI